MARAQDSDPTVTEPREELALAVARSWQEEFGTPLPWVSGSRALAQSVAFYAPEHPRYWSFWNTSVETPWVESDRVMRDGGAIVCAAEDLACQELAQAWSPLPYVVQVAKQAHGQAFAPSSYKVYWVSPGDSFRSL
jgi:hypothetical protein